MSLPVSSAAGPEAPNVLRTVGRRVAAFFLLPDSPEATAPQDAWLPPVPEATDEPAPEEGLAAGQDGPSAATADGGLRAPRSAAVLGAAEDGPSAAASGGPGRPWSAAVLGAAQDVPAVAAALANRLASGAAPLVGCWSPAPASSARQDEPEPAAPPALPGARRLAAALTAAGTPATGRGRLAWAALPPAPEVAANAWASARESAGADRATVLAVAGPRPAAFDPLLAVQDLVVLVLRDGEADLAALANATFEATGATVVTVPPLAGAARLVALAGLGRLRLPLDGPAAAPALVSAGLGAQRT